MLIRNFSDLATSEKRRRCLEVLEAGLAAADPASIMPEFVTKSHIRAGKKTLELSQYSKIYTVAFGKAGDSMTRAVNAIIPVQGGIIVIPRGSKSVVRGKKFQIFNSGHPRPDRTSVKAAKETVKFLQNRRRDELVVFLVSGGASALLALPDGIMLDDKIHVTDLLLKSGATIQEFNCVRKHLSKIKGGRLVSNLRCHALSLIMSDVEGDDVSSIASGTTFRDDTTFQDAVGIIEKYGLERKIPPAVRNVLEDGMEGRIPDTPKKEEIPNCVIASNSVCIRAMREKASQMGYATHAVEVFGDIKDAVKKIVKNIPDRDNSCLIFGGEPTVKVLGKGTGGRNHEMVLRLLKNTQGLKKMVIASIGTDGIDGNTAFAGAITENGRTDTETVKGFLRNSDSGRFFQKQGSSIATGLTHTNLMDIGVVMR